MQCPPNIECGEYDETEEKIIINQINSYNRMKKILFLMLATALPFLFYSCSEDDSISENEGIAEEEEEIKALPEMDNVSLDYHPSDQVIELPRDVESEGVTISLKYDSYWITQLELNGSTISFKALENTESETGHRFDTIFINNRGINIGSICVSQARKPISPTRLVWAVSSAIYRNKALGDLSMSGQEMTKAIYDLEKTTNGKDSYKNYPAFAYCIEMNHDPENNMEWHLPSLHEMEKYANGQSYEGTPFDKHNYWWSASENSLNGNAFSLYAGSTASRGAESKGKDWWVMAFRNGKMNE